MQVFQRGLRGVLHDNLSRAARKTENRREGGLANRAFCRLAVCVIVCLVCRVPFCVYCVHVLSTTAYLSICWHCIVLHLEQHRRKQLPTSICHAIITEQGAMSSDTKAHPIDDDSNSTTPPPIKHHHTDIKTNHFLYHPPKKASTPPKTQDPPPQPPPVSGSGHTGN